MGGTDSENDMIAIISKILSLVYCQNNEKTFLNIIKYLCATTCVTKRFYTIICIFVQHVVNYVYAKP